MICGVGVHGQLSFAPFFPRIGESAIGATKRSSIGTISLVGSTIVCLIHCLKTSAQATSAVVDVVL